MNSLQHPLTLLCKAQQNESGKCRIFNKRSNKFSMTHFTLKYHNDHAVSYCGSNPVAVDVCNLLKCLFDAFCVHRNTDRWSGLNYVPKVTWLMILLAATCCFTSIRLPNWQMCHKFLVKLILNHFLVNILREFFTVKRIVSPIYLTLGIKTKIRAFKWWLYWILNSHSNEWAIKRSKSVNSHKNAK